MAFNRFNPKTILSTYASISSINDNFNQVATWIDKLVARAGESVNSLLADLDANSFRLKNLNAGVDPADATNLAQVQALVASAPKGAKGDTGGNVLSVGAFATLSATTIPAGAKIIQLSGTTVDGDTGAGRQFVEAAEVTSGFVTANPLISFRDLANRGFREVDPKTGIKIVPFLLIHAGQSNALGANTGGLNPASPGVKVWDPVAVAWGSSDYTLNPLARAAPDGNSAKNNIALAAAHKIYEQTRRPVYLVLDAQSGRPISDWVGAGTSSVRYAALKTKINAALATTQFTTHSKTTIDLLIWSQGEEDDTESRTYSQYLTDMGTFDTQLRAETFFTEFTPCVITGMSGLHERYEAAGAHRNFCYQSNGRWAYASSKGLKTQFDSTGSGDYTHWLGTSLWEFGYNRIGPMVVDGIKHSDDIPPNLFYGRGTGRASQSDQTAIATFDNLVNWDSRTAGPTVNDTYTGDGSTTAFTLTLNGTISTVTVNGVTKVSPTDYSVTGLVITFVVPPANTVPIVVTYALDINGPAASGSISWGHRCFADGNYTFAGGYLCSTDNLCNYTILYGRQNSGSSTSAYGAGFGFQNVLNANYQLVAGRGNTVPDDGGVALGKFCTFTTTQADPMLFQYGVGTSSGARKNAFQCSAASLFDLPQSTGRYKVNGTQVVGTRDTGWTADTGTARKVANATYAAGTTLTYSGTYVQAEQTAMATRMAAVETALQNITQAQKAIKDALIAHGLIGT